MTDITNTKKAVQTSTHSGAAAAESEVAATEPVQPAVLDAVAKPKKHLKATARPSAKSKVKKAMPATKGKESPKHAVPREPRQTKAATVEAMLCRRQGASLEAICTATSWQAHTCRAFLTGLRKKGKNVIRDKGTDGTTIYRIGPAAPMEVGA